VKLCGSTVSAAFIFAGHCYSDRPCTRKGLAADAMAISAVKAGCRGGSLLVRTCRRRPRSAAKEIGPERRGVCIAAFVMMLICVGGEVQSSTETRRLAMPTADQEFHCEATTLAAWIFRVGRYLPIGPTRFDRSGPNS